MNNDKSFAVYAVILVSGIASVITASVWAGFSTLPSPALFLEHVALGLAIRASYKTIGGFDWADWSFTGDRAAAADASDFATPSGTAAQEG